MHQSRLWLRAWLLFALLAFGKTIIVNARAAQSNSNAAVAIRKINHDLWSFKKPQEPVLPEVRYGAWVKTPVDRFILKKLEKNGLTPSPQADRRTLIRRAYYDLIGLPPSAADVEAFVADSSSDAYEKLVDRLLASPRYGERWARYWLDLARYSDTKGYAYAREERQFFHAWNYRDWVIGALNEDMPYDRFLLLQIAADQAGPTDGAKLPDDLAAMGFLTVGRRFLGVVPDIIDDRIDVTMRTTLGLTVGCARCHDHKFDPIPTADYYSLYGVFAGSTETSVCLDPSPPNPTDAYVKYEKGLQERIDKLDMLFNKSKDELVGRLRAKIADYLAAVPSLAKHPDDNFYSQLGPDDLNPVIIRQWRHYLFEKSHGFDPIWAPWTALTALSESDLAEQGPVVLRALLSDPTHHVNQSVSAAFASAQPKTFADVARIYGTIFDDMVSRWPEMTDNPEPDPLPDAEDEALRLVVYGSDSPARVPKGSVADTEWFFPEGTRVQIDMLQAQIERWKIATPGAPRYALVLEDRPEQHNPRVFKRGNPNTSGAEISRHFLSLVAGENPPAFSVGSGRLEMARDIASKDNPLTARVMVNRIWQHHFGAPLVTTPSDFGNRSDPPSHPELLDWLAVQFMKNGWSIKSMHRLLMCSATYRQESADNPAAAAIDPENRLLARANRIRLDFEATRDSLLAASGDLDLTPGGRPADIGGARRTIYCKIDRQFVSPMARTFDFACPDLHTAQRSATTVPQQALFFMNSPFVTALAQRLSNRHEIAAAKSPAGRIQTLYEIIYQRRATDRQVTAGLAFIESLSKPKPKPLPPPTSVASAWKYGYGEYDPFDDRMAEFTPLPYFSGTSWQGGSRWPDAKLGWVQLTATGGHAGNDMAHAAIRRWTAPRDMAISISGEVRHDYAAGHGIAARLISDRVGTLGEWTLHNSKADASVARLEVKRGETIDFVVDYAGTLNSNMFTWSPIITALDKPAGKAKSESWMSAADFQPGAPPETTDTMDPWATYAHVLLMSNEFLFVD